MVDRKYNPTTELEEELLEELKKSRKRSRYLAVKLDDTERLLKNALELKSVNEEIKRDKVF